MAAGRGARPRARPAPPPPGPRSLAVLARRPLRRPGGRRRCSRIRPPPPAELRCQLTRRRRLRAAGVWIGTTAHLRRRRPGRLDDEDQRGLLHLRRASLVRHGPTKATGGSGPEDLAWSGPTAPRPTSARLTDVEPGTSRRTRPADSRFARPADAASTRVVWNVETDERGRHGAVRRRSPGRLGGCRRSRSPATMSTSVKRRTRARRSTGAPATSRADGSRRAPRAGLGEDRRRDRIGDAGHRRTSCSRTLTRASRCISRLPWTGDWSCRATTSPDGGFVAVTSPPAGTSRRGDTSATAGGAARHARRGRRRPAHATCSTTTSPRGRPPSGHVQQLSRRAR